MRSRRGKSSKILNAQLLGLFREMHQATRRDAPRAFATHMWKEGRRTSTDKGRERDARTRAETEAAFLLFYRVSIQRSDEKRAGRRAFELSSQTCVAGRKKNDARRRVILPRPLSLAICVESRHCFRFSIHRSPLRIVIKIDAIKYIKRYGASQSDNVTEFLKTSFRLPFGCLEILIVMGYT